MALSLYDVIQIQRAIETEANMYGNITTASYKRIIGSLLADSINVVDYATRFTSLAEGEMPNLLDIFLDMVTGISQTTSFMNDPELPVPEKMDIMEALSFMGTIEESALENLNRITKRIANKTNEMVVLDYSKAEIIEAMTIEADRAGASAKTTSATAKKVGSEFALEKARQANPNVIGYIWDSELDSRTTLTCMGLNGNKYLYANSGSKPKPPAHFNCRSTTRSIYKDGAIYEDVESFGEWVAEEINKPMTRTYEDKDKNTITEVAWEHDNGSIAYAKPGKIPFNYTKKEASENGWSIAKGGEARRAMGETRYKLMMDGKLKIEAFTDLGNNPYTLEELQDDAWVSFMKAGLPVDDLSTGALAYIEKMTPDQISQLPKYIQSQVEVIRAPIPFNQGSQEPLQGNNLQYLSDILAPERERLKELYYANKRELDDLAKKLIPPPQGTYDTNIDEMIHNNGLGDLYNSRKREWLIEFDDSPEFKQYIDSMFKYTEGRNLSGMKRIMYAGDTEGFSEETIKQYNELMESMTLYKYDNNEAIYRGVDFPSNSKYSNQAGRDRLANYISMQPGDTWSDKGTTSWSTEITRAESFANVGNDTFISVVMEVEKKDIELHPLGFGVKEISQYENEHEVIMRNSEKFVVMENKVDSKGVRRIKLRPVDKIDQKGRHALQVARQEFEDTKSNLERLNALSKDRRFKENRVTVTIEATPSSTTSTEIYNKLLDSTTEDRLKYEQQHINMVEELMDKYDIKGEIDIAKGAYAGQTNPNIQIYLDGNEVKDPGNLNAMLSEFGKATDQDGVAWYKTDANAKEKNGIAISLSDELSREEFRASYLKMIEVNPALGLVEKPGRVEIINYGDQLTDAELKAIGNEVYNETGGFSGKGKTKAKLFGSESGWNDSSSYDEAIQARDKEWKVWDTKENKMVQYDPVKDVEAIQENFLANYDNKDLIDRMIKGKDINYKPDFLTITGDNLPMKTLNEIKTLDEFEVLAHSNSYENIIGFDSDGKKLFAEQGQEFSAQIPGLYKYSMKNGTVSHNHPSKKHPLSKGDIDAFSSYGLKEMRAVSGDNVYVLSDPNGIMASNSVIAKNFRDDIGTAYSSWVESSREVATAKGIKQTAYLDSEEALLEWYETSRGIAEDNGLKYTKEKFYK
jgi:ribulose bisphosphate carboxylase small subunit